ncbi:MAG: hypothetical protein HY707_04550 [Ignavibacteriae bacterium]|nr:hypothetical protein [Ignavibacteriota bacterium]
MLKLTKSQFNLLADAASEASAIVFGALLVSGVFSQEPVRGHIIVIGIILYILCVSLALFFKKKGNSDD